MTSIAAIPENKKAANGFYPTPAALADRMMACVQWNYVDSILEPSAGKGDLALAAARRVMKRCGGRYDDKIEKVDMDCIEIDPNLRAIMKEKGLRVVHDDFFTYRTMKRYSLIVMNPPFEDGAKHLMWAMSFLKPGGQLVCLLNAETIQNPFSADRQRLVSALNALDAKIEIIKDAFLDAERKTGVEIAMISYRAPKVEKEDGLLTEKLKPGHKYVDMDEETQRSLTKADFVEAIVDRYNYEIECGCLLIREHRVMDNLLKTSISPDHGYTFLLGLSLDGSAATVNDYVRAVRKKYWSALFCAPQFMDQLTSNLRDMLHGQVEKLADYEFSTFNIYEIMRQLSAKVNSGVEETIMKLFDDWTRKYHWDVNSKNRHYFDGWCTNDAFAVNRKVIIPMYTWDGIFNRFDFAWKAADKIADIERVMNWLDGGRTAEGRPVRDIFIEAENAKQNTKIETKYFWITFFKKGTCHIEFKNMDLLAKFNIFAARGKNWLPPSFGRKRYAEMNAEEQKVVKSFMGSEKNYDVVVDHADYFLATGSETLNLSA